MRRSPQLLVVIAVIATLAGCSASSSVTPAPSRSASRPPSPSPTPSVDPLAGLSLQQRVGQLFMVGTPATTLSPVTLDAVRSLHVGGVFLSGRSTAGASTTLGVVGQLTAADGDGHPLLVATDQEGGEVQVLRGTGFSSIPTALAQSSLAPAALQQQATVWGGELQAAGLNMNLAPVADVVASAQQAAANPPIGQLMREYGYGADSVLPHAQAFAAGMLSSGVVPVLKHFPGLGAVTQNTDFTSSVTDGTTNASSPSVSVFGSLVHDGMPAVMVSTAIYTQIDANAPAAFSAPVVTGLLRGTLGFDGVVITDDVSAAAQVQAWSPADRAILSIAAGDDIVLVSAAPDVAAGMVAAVVAKAQTDAVFAALVDAACTRVLALKQRYLKP